jgi:hypothetical protein
MEATRSSETPVNFRRTTRRYVTEDQTLCGHEFTVTMKFWSLFLNILATTTFSRGIIFPEVGSFSVEYMEVGSSGVF